ncbi:helicase associated domain-containing protein, partial [Streptomyces sp. NPDC008163]|uniref:helicase associated domain-containing protein n=1 Tax=Streptomyces sp. NPDC008163 TaxID=3364818 RepID=UPI0036E9D7FE
PVRLGVWLSNTRARRDKLTVDQLAALANLGMVWAGPAPAAETAAPGPPAAPPTLSAAPARRAVCEHHEECDEDLFEGANCSCWSIKRFGPPSEREGYGDDF